MKVTTSDILAILRRFGEADESNVPRNIDQVKQTHPSPINQLVAFRFARTHYYALFDETAEDRKEYIIHEVQTAKSDVKGDLLINPTSHMETYGLPFKGKDVYLFKAASNKTRLDLLLVKRYPDVSRSTWQKHIKAGHVAVNSETVFVPKTEITEADSVSISLPDVSDFSNQELPIVYIDDHVIVVNKPAGILTHSKGALNDEFTVADFFRRYTHVGLDTNRPGIVHRLDRDTSGIIIGARTPEAYELLKHQFADRKAKKEYLAIVTGSLREQKAIIDIPLERSPSVPSTFRAGTNGKSAQTLYEVLDTDSASTLVLLQPHTGRTHQLRVHMAYLGHPIMGDRVYGKAADRLYLHAYRLEITIPGGQRRTFTINAPSEFVTKYERYFKKTAA